MNTALRNTCSEAAIKSDIASRDWQDIHAMLDRDGFSVLPDMLDGDACRSLAGCYGDANRFRSRVVMARHGFGRGEYQYFRYPLPSSVQTLRESLYPPLARIANDWNTRLNIETRYPRSHEAYLKRCHRAGQTKPTPLLLEYGKGDYNCLHQDLYGAHVFPLQLAILLSAPGDDFAGGEFVLTEQRPRMQSRAMVVPLRQGDGVIFPVRERPVRGTKRTYRVMLRHGVSCVRAGNRRTLGVIFHDAA